jgi:hypothetical protein
VRRMTKWCLIDRDGDEDRRCGDYISRSVSFQQEGVSNRFSQGHNLPLVSVSATLHASRPTTMLDVQASELLGKVRSYEFKDIGAWYSNLPGAIITNTRISGSAMAEDGTSNAWVCNVE